MTTGVFFHEKFRGNEWLIIGDKFRNFPRAMERQLKLSNVRLFEPEKVSEDLLRRIHTSGFVRNLKKAWYCEGALISVGGCVGATEKILSGDLENALVFTVAAGHHAERDSAWGGTYASCAGPAFYHAREVCEGRYLVLTHGGRRRDVAEFIFPRIVEILAAE